MKTRSLNTNDPQAHAANIQKMLTDIIEHAREDIDKISEPKAQALFETAAEVLTGLRAAFQHYERGSEKALRPETRRV